MKIRLIVPFTTRTKKSRSKLQWEWKNEKKGIIELYVILAVILLSTSSCGNANLPDETIFSEKTEITVTMEITGATETTSETQKPTVSTEPSVGLAFTQIGKSYSVVGIGTCKDTDIVIPTEYNGLPVKKIGKDAFKNCKSLTSINIPSGVTSIEDSAFFGCDKLASVRLGESSMLMSIGSSAFSGCSSLTSIVIPKGVTSIGEYAFNGCSRSLESIVVAEGNTVYHSAGNCLIETANKTLLKGCQNSVIPADGSIMTIGAGSFYECWNLTSLEIPEGITSIESGAFSECRSLTNIEIPLSVTSIGRNAFFHCYHLRYNEYDNGIYNGFYLGNEQNPYVSLIDVRTSSGSASCTIHRQTKVIAGGHSKGKIA